MRTPVFRSFPRLQTFATSLILLLLFTQAVVAQTQSTTGTVEVVVSDANGAVIPAANVEIKNLDTNLTKNGTTDDNGRFVALALQPGNYSVTVSKQGFTTGVLEKTQLTVGEAKNIPVTLTVSQVAERVVQRIALGHP